MDSTPFLPPESTQLDTRGQATSPDPYSGPYPSARKYCCGRLTRKWYYVLVVSVILALLITAALLIIFVAGRSLAQRQLNDAQINVQMTLRNPNDATQSIDVEINGSVDNRGSITATLQATTIYLEFNDQEFGHMAFPEIHATGGALTPILVNTTIFVDDVNVWNDFNKDVLLMGSLNVRMKAKVTAKALGISYKDLDFNKLVTIEGFNGFSDPAPQMITNTVFDTTADSILANLEVSIVNQGSVALQGIGRLNFTIEYQNMVIGYSLADKSSDLNFGETVLSNTVHFVRNTENAETVSDLLSNYYSGVDVTVTLTGSPYTTQINLLNPAMQYFRTNFTLKGLVHNEDKLFAAVYQPLNLTKYFTALQGFIFGQPLPEDIVDRVVCPAGGLQVFMDVYVQAHNPLDIPQTLDSAQFDISFDGYGVGDIHGDPSDSNNCYFNPRAGGHFLTSNDTNMNFVLNPKETRSLKQRLCLNTQTDLFVLLSATSAMTVCRGYPPPPTPLPAGVPVTIPITVQGLILGQADRFKDVKLKYKQTGVTVYINPLN